MGVAGRPPDAHHMDGGGVVGDQGTRVVLAMKELRKLFREVRRLVDVAERELDEAGGWETQFGNKSWDASSHIGTPSRWMPDTIYRYFADEDRQTLLLLAIHLCEPEYEQLTEPWVAFGYYRYREGEQVPEKVPSGWQWLHLEAQHPPDGTLAEHRYTEDAKYGDVLSSQASLALPLMAIQTIEDLRTKVLQPVLEHLAAAE